LNSIYTIYGDERLDRKIADDMAMVVRTVREIIPAGRLTAVILGGGYGRGEGGVVRKENGEAGLFNDYDMFIIVNGLSASARSKYNAALRRASELLTSALGLEVDFSPLKNRQELAGLPATMMWYELKHGHRVIYGPENILDSVPDFDGNQLPPDNAMQLMLNRGTGLLLARDRLREESITADDNDFITRNIYKAVMACGDAFLMLRQRFDSSYCRRRELLAEFHNDPLIAVSGLLPLYQESIDYKLRPTPGRKPAELLALYHRALSIFHDFYSFTICSVYGLELNPSFDLKFYDAMLEVAAPHGFKELVKNFLLNLYYVKPRRGPVALLWRYPRHRLYIALPQLLLVNHPPAPFAGTVLGLDENANPDDMYDRFLNLWRRFN